jgi:alpha-2-macroglobulin
MARHLVRSALAGASFVFCASMSLVCSRVPPPQTQKQAEGARIEPLHRAASAPKSLVFPPDDPGGWSTRREMDGSPAHEELHVVEPQLDADGHFTLEGQSVRVVFNDVVAPRVHWQFITKPPKNAIVITPAVPGTIAWADEKTLEFRASRPFDPDATYEVRVEGVVASGKKLPETWHAKFLATPRVEVAGKVINYIPKPGAPRVIAVHPMSGETVGLSPELSVVFDQPIDLAKASPLVKLTGDDGSEVKVTLRHPAGPSFQGIKLDPRHVVIARPVKAFSPGDDVELAATDGADKPGPVQKHGFKVAKALARTDLRCEEYGSGRELCNVTLDRVRTSGKEVDVVFNNPIGTPDKELLSHVVFTPWVKNLRVRHEYWDGGRISITGELLPSTHYAVAISGITDAYGGRLAEPVKISVDTTPLASSLSMPEGTVLLDATKSRSIPVTTRNVKKIELSTWEIPDGDAVAFRRAVAETRLHQTPAEDPVRTVVTVDGQRDALVKTNLDLAAKLTPGRLYVITARPFEIGWDAPEQSYESGAEAAHAPVALVTMGNGKTLAVHARALSAATLVHVARLGSGEPVSGAAVKIGDLEAKTDARGVALVKGERSSDAVVLVDAGGDKAMLSLTEGGIGAKDLFPDLSVDGDSIDSEVRGIVLSDRGVYRPGSDVMVKGNIRKPEGDRLSAIVGTKVRVKLVDPSGGEAFSDVLTTSEAGSVDRKITLDPGAKIGRYRLRLEDSEHAEPALAESMIQVADFEPPRFKVDVEPKPSEVGKLSATVRAKYLFGAPMDSAMTTWTLRRSAAEFPHGPLTDAGLVFRRRHEWYEDQNGRETWTRTGEGVLGADGTLKVDMALPLAPEDGPQDFTLEADVTDSSYRHVAGRTTMTKHPASRYAGVHIGESWVAAGDPVSVQLGVIDTEGKPIVGVPVSAKLVRVDWTYTSHRTASGALETKWITTNSDAGSCDATTESSPVACTLVVPSSGDYQIRAEVDGKIGGVTSIWAWRYGETQRATFPTKGRTMEVRTDKGRYRPGETAHVLVRNPYPAATAILTTEAGGLVAYESKRVTDPAVLFDVPVRAASAPYVHAVVTLLPIGAAGEGAVDSKIGAVRIPVAEESMHLAVAVVSDKPSYMPGDDAEIHIDVKDGAKGDGQAEIALAVVDEGVLRLTGFHAVDPTVALRPGHPLAFRAYDTRQDLSEWLNRSHVAGDGGGEEGAASIVAARRNFVQTALWIPDLHTDASGHATAKLHLPDNLTEFRMMAVVIDKDGKAAGAESSFTVTKPLMIIPVVPRFALVGDGFEAATMLHNNTKEAIETTVTLGETALGVKVPAEGHQRVSFPIKTDKSGEQTLVFRLDAFGKRVDQVEAKIRIEEPGYDEKPKLAGTFEGSEDVLLKVPEGLHLTGEELVSIEVGENLWPELGARMEYLLDYPHGCVEQTTSSTLPLLAARTILPRIGFRGLTPKELDKRIASGLTRLASMRTGSGGLAYWPGGTDPNVFGTAYAMRAVVLAKAAGIEPPAGLLEGMQRFLGDSMLSASNGPEVVAAIAESLGETGSLSDSTADALFDTREKQSVFGLASLAMALHTLPGQDDRVATVLNDIEASFGDGISLLKQPTSNDFYYYGSPTRSRAQAAIALARLRPGARVLPRLLDALAGETESYTTQATAWSLLAVAEHLAGEPKAGTNVTATLDGVALANATDLGFGSKELRIPVADIAGRSAKLHLEAPSGTQIGFMVKGRWKRSLSDPGAHMASHTKVGPEVYRVYTDPKGRPVDLAKVHAGDVVRVLVVARLPDMTWVERSRRGYVAVTDKLAGGFEPIDPDLATVARPPDLDPNVPFGELFRENAGSADHVELHDDRVNVYFDHPWGDYVTASYLLRATTPGTFTIPPASGELMYEADSEGYSDVGKVTIL